MDLGSEKREDWCKSVRVLGLISVKNVQVLIRKLSKMCYNIFRKGDM